MVFKRAMANVDPISHASTMQSYCYEFQARHVAMLGYKVSVHWGKSISTHLRGHHSHFDSGNVIKDPKLVQWSPMFVLARASTMNGIS